MKNITGGTGVTAKRVPEPAKDSLRLRIVSGLVMASVTVALVWLGEWYFAGLVTVASVLMIWEWDRLCGGSGKGIHIWLMGATIVAALALFQLGRLSEAMTIGAVGTLIAFLIVGKSDRDRAKWVLLGGAYILVPSLALLWLRNQPTMGLETVVWLLVVVWATDTGAYFSGRTFGGPKMAPKISPNKTWSGLIGGVCIAAMVGVPAGILAGTQSFVYLMVSGAILAVVGQIGDVFESSIKRRFGVKDSGTIIPGHGGLFDRLDSLLFVAVVYAAMMILTNGATVWR